MTGNMTQEDIERLQAENKRLKANEARLLANDEHNAQAMEAATATIGKLTRENNELKKAPKRRERTKRVNGGRAP